MMRRSPHHRSPLSKLSHAASAAATGLAAATSAAADRATVLAESTARAAAAGGQLSHAVAAKAAHAAERGMKSPEKMMRTPEKKRATPERRGGGARRTPGRGGVRDRIKKFDSASKSNLNIHGRREGRQEDEDPRRQWARQHRHEHNEGTRRGQKERRTKAPEGGEARSPHREEKNERNEGREKENAPNRREGLKKQSPPFRRKKEGRRAENDQRAMPTKMMEEDGDNDEAKADEAMDIAALHRAAVSQTSGEGHAKNHAPNDKGGRGVRSKKREQWDPDEHPLIQSPLKKHMKRVRDAACSNATGTLTKEPFPLLPPGAGDPLRAVAGWNDKTSAADDAMGEALGELGAVTGSIPLAVSVGVDRDMNMNEGEGESTVGRREDAGEALDLLTSAAFLFEHSRRNLG